MPHDHNLKAMLSGFFRTEAAGGVVLIMAAIVAVIVANGPLYGLYNVVLHDVSFFGGSVLHWINDGLMAIFFLLIGLEIKRELVEGELSTRDRAILPILAAVGGMAVPALIYVAINFSYPDNLSGWAIPAATDIAFAICVIAMTGSRVPVSVKILLMAIAVMDDLGAIIIIALFYGHGFHAVAFVLALVIIGVMAVLNRRNVTSIIPYIILGLLLWAAILQSGLHATLAGVITALFIPLSDRKNPKRSPARLMEKKLHPWVAFLIMPVFGFANAGVPFAGMTLSSITEPVTMGIILGLVLGKAIGIFCVLFIAIKARVSPMPLGATWLQLFGMSVVCGIGFTMSLFIGALALPDAADQAAIRLGVMGGSVISAVIGFSILRFGPASKPS